MPMPWVMEGRPGSGAAALRSMARTAAGEDAPRATAVTPIAHHTPATPSTPASQAASGMREAVNRPAQSMGWNV